MTTVFEQSPKKIAVLFGGCSPEYSVSLQSAFAIISHLSREKYTPVLIGITQEGGWFTYHGPLEKIAADTWHNPLDCIPAALSLNRSKHAVLQFVGNATQELTIDAAFPVLHGKNGEDGTVQGLLELAGIPIVGCDTLSSALCMDKHRAHCLAHAAGVAVPRSHLLSKDTTLETLLTLGEAVGYPLFVKPLKAGSSFGITKVLTKIELPAAVALARNYDNDVIIEENISGFEVGCAILGNEVLTVGEVDEIELSAGFFDYTEKYSLKTSAIHVPARIPPHTAQLIKDTAITIYRALGCKGFARVDLFLSNSGKIFFNEVNTIPGFTPHSRFPNMLKAAGLTFEQLVTQAIQLAVGE